MKRADLLEVPLVVLVLLDTPADFVRTVRIDTSECNV